MHRLIDGEDRMQSSGGLNGKRTARVDLVWLVGRLAPDFKTIAGVRNDNRAPVQAVCGQFVEFCHRLKLFTRAVVAIEGSKFKPVNNRQKNYTVAKVTGRTERAVRQNRAYLRALDRAEPKETGVAERNSSRPEGADRRPGPTDATHAGLKAMRASTRWRR